MSRVVNTFLSLSRLNVPKNLTQYFFSCSSSQCLFWFLCWRTTCLQVVMGLSRSWHTNFHIKTICTTCRFAFDKVGLFLLNFVIVGCTDIPFPPGVAPPADEIDESSTRLQSLLSRYP
jgi:hypothetical protein